MQLAGADYLGVVGATFAVSALATPLLRRYALRNQIVDSPDGERKLQKAPIPYLGGIAIVSAVAIIILGAVLIGPTVDGDLTLALSVLVPGLLLAGVGLLDDIKGLTPGPRFVAQSLAGAATAWLLTRGGTVSALTDIVWLDVLITIVWVIGVTNAMNLMDNMDGLASGVAAIAALTYTAVALVNGQFLVGALALALAGAALGFLVYNRHPARIYMGDSGALFIGFTLAAIGIRINLVDAPPLTALLVPAIVLAVPVLDTTVVVISRLQRGLSPFTGGRDHLSHRLVRRGHSVPSAVSRLWLLAAFTGAAALVLPQLSGMTSMAAILVLVGSYGWLLVWFLRIPAVDPEPAATTP